MVPQNVTTLQNGYKVKKIIIHEDFNNTTLASDVALLQLETPIPLVDDIQATAALPKQGHKVATGTKCMFLGWGISDVNMTVTMVNNTEKFDVYSITIPQKLQEAEMTITSHDSCAKKMSNVFWIKTVHVDEETMICGDGQNTKSGCSGDNGAPLVCKEGAHWVLQGIGSWGDVWCRPVHYTVFTRISKFADWIKLKTHYGCSKRVAIDFYPRRRYSFIIYSCDSHCDSDQEEPSDVDSSGSDSEDESDEEQESASSTNGADNLDNLRWNTAINTSTDFAFNEQVGLTIDMPNNSTCKDFFKLFFTEEVYSLILEGN
ncbi:Chymotrypsin-like elastase family member 2A [Exaiptasia diaphana]|nr:Chymotrypsin-like elastase family member 2A [Exaiptasia diaphana]